MSEISDEKVTSQSVSNEISIQNARKGRGILGTLLDGLSMAPFHGDGDILPTRVVRDSDPLKVGDLITFIVDGEIVCHAIDSIDNEGIIKTKGLNPDTNQEIDSWSIEREDVVGIADFSEEFATDFEQLRAQGNLPFVTAKAMSNQFDKLSSQIQLFYEKVTDLEGKSLEERVDLLMEFISYAGTFMQKNSQDLQYQAQIRVKFVSMYESFLSKTFTGYSQELFAKMFKKVFAPVVYGGHLRNIKSILDEVKILTEIVRNSGELYDLHALIRNLNSKVNTFRFRKFETKIDYINKLITDNLGFTDYNQLFYNQFLNLQTDSKDNIYGKPDKNFFGSGKLKQLVFDKKISNTEDLLIKMKQYLRIDLNKDIDWNFLDVFARCREIWGSSQWPTSVGGHNPASIFQFDLEFQQNNENPISYQSGFYFSIYGEQIMPGYQIIDGQIINDPNPDNNYNSLYPIRSNEFHCERKQVIAFEDKMNLDNLVNGEIKIYCENTICFGCLDNVVRLFKRCNQRGGNLKIVIYHAIQFDMSPNNGLPYRIELDPLEYQRNPNFYDHYLI